MTTPFKTQNIQFKNEYPIISIGSGMGKREKELIDLGYNVISIDPSKDRRDRWTQQKRVMKPNFKYVGDLINKNKDIIGNCNVLIEYPMTDYVSYDFCAIYDLQPKEVVILTTKGGSSGGLLLHYWLNNCGIHTTNKQRTRDSLKNAGLYFNIPLDYDMELIDDAPKNFRDAGKEDIYIYVSGIRNYEVCEREQLSSRRMEMMGASPTNDKDLDRTMEILESEINLIY